MRVKFPQARVLGYLAHQLQNNSFKSHRNRDSSETPNVISSLSESVSFGTAKQSPAFSAYLSVACNRCSRLVYELIVAESGAFHIPNTHGPVKISMGAAEMRGALNYSAISLFYAAHRPGGGMREGRQLSCCDFDL